MATVRWYNRLAAWAWDALGPGTWWVDLAAPAWEEGQEEDAEEAHEGPWDAYDDEDLRQAYMEGYKDAEHEWRDR